MGNKTASKEAGLISDETKDTATMPLTGAGASAAGASEATVAKEPAVDGGQDATTTDVEETSSEAVVPDAVDQVAEVEGVEEAPIERGVKDTAVVGEYRCRCSVEFVCAVQ